MTLPKHLSVGRRPENRPLPATPPVLYFVFMAAVFYPRQSFLLRGASEDKKTWACCEWQLRILFTGLEVVWQMGLLHTPQCMTTYLKHRTETQRSSDICRAVTVCARVCVHHFKRHTNRNRNKTCWSHQMTDQSSRCSIRTFYDLTGFILNLYATKKVHLWNPAHLFSDVCYDFYFYCYI